MIKKILGFIFFGVATITAWSQVDSTFVDSKYLEDQFYLGLSYNVLVSKPPEFVQNGVSGGVYLGYIRDFPINKQRNVGFGIGIGYSYNIFVQNLKITKSGDTSEFEIVPPETYEVNRLSTKAVEFPIEFRWRTSTATKYSFWRVYGGLKLGYVFSSRSVYEDDVERIEVEGIEELETWQYGLSLSVGYGSINLNIYYSLNPLLEEAKTIDDQPIDFSRLNIGLIFYIL